MPYIRLEISELIKKMHQSISTTNNWDVLCSYDVESLNRVLLEEYLKYPVNSQLMFSFNRNISINFQEQLNCYLRLSNITLSFSHSISGVYNLKIPIANNSYCIKTTFYKSKIDSNDTIIIPKGSAILASGYLKTVLGTGTSNVVSNSNKIIELGDSKQANIVLHFGKDLTNIEVTHELSDTTLQDIFDETKNYFVKSITEVNFNIVQVVKETTKFGDVVLTPRSFTITTMADKDSTTGVLNIWVQTNESGRPQGDSTPSFEISCSRDNKAMPLPIGYSSSVIFSYSLLNLLLQKNFDVTFIKKNTYNNYNINEENVVELVPKKDKIFKQVLSYTMIIDLLSPYGHKVRHPLTKFQDQLKCPDLIIDHEKSPFILLSNEVGNLTLRWLWHQEFNCMRDTIDLLMGGNAPRNSKAQFKVEVNKFFSYRVVNNHTINVNVNIDKEDININTRQIKTSDFFIYKVLGLDKVVFRDMNQKIRDYIVNRLSEVTIDFGLLNYFAEANILFNEERFSISTDKQAIFIPGDIVIVGDIEEQSDNHNRYKRYISYDRKRNSREEVIDYVSISYKSAASNINSPINTVVSWLRSNNVMKYETVKECNSIMQFNINNLLTLFSFITRYFTKVKPYNAEENPVSLLEVRSCALNIITKFNELLSELSTQKNIIIGELDFDPIDLISNLEKEIANDNYTRVGKVLYNSILNRSFIIENHQFDNCIRQKIHEMLEQENTCSIYAQQLNEDINNNSTTMGDTQF